ncbi:TetR family transcriptional regulator [Nocardia brasiliensis]|uniref:TetR family transcriptional regulator n=1 Tax=Nocardia brasiliensis TaxID=37326 RepID=A0A6G9XPX3_NOCBR|nr:TetR/AcrR family transcriptional regulator [Nocardia brasiliensis]QIS03002.1 TetR family transcriptional regulator [Nocardia brasiliensis]
MAEELSLRERKKLDTRRALSDATLNLAFERGLDNVTREDIAAAAGVSVRTFNNYFANKFEALAYRNLDRIRRSLDEFRARPDDEPLWTAIAESIVAPFVADGIRDVPPTKAQLTGVRTLIEVAQNHVPIGKELTDEWVAAIARRTGTDPERDMYPHLVAGVIIAVMRAAARAYVNADPPVLITGLLRQGFDGVAAGLPEPSGH